jgi:hypothetical protein
LSLELGARDDAIEAVLRAFKREDVGSWIGFAKAIRDNADASEAARSSVGAMSDGSEEEEIVFGVGFRLACGLIYATVARGPEQQPLPLTAAARGSPKAPARRNVADWNRVPGQAG